MLHTFTFGDIARENARSWPQHTAVVDGDARFTYAQVDERATRLANALARADVRAGDRLIWIGQNSHRVLEAMIAAAKLGAQLCVSNWRQTVDELAWVLDDWKPAVVFWESRTPDSAQTSDPLRTKTDALWIDGLGDGPDGYEGLLAAASPIDPELDVDPDEGLFALYTAAFDGKPQAAVMSHNGIIAHNLALALQRRVEMGDFTYLACGPMFHVGTMMWVAATFHLGGTTVMMPKFDAAEACRIIEAEGVQAMLTVPSMLDDLARANADGRYDLSTLTVTPLSEALNAMITPDTSPFGRRLGGYGQTEVGGMMTYAGLGGRPSPLLRVRIVDEHDNDVATGEVGEIVARGPHIMNGYHDRPDLNAVRQRGGWHHTGDLGRREADGSITFIGPKQRMIKSGGENIYPAEVENALRAHPDIRDAAVIGAPDAKWDQRVKALVVRGEGTTLSDIDVIEHVRNRIASYKKPREVVFVESIPRSGFSIDYATLDAVYGGGGYPSNG